MTRIVAGVAGGRRLDAPRGRATRPTSDRVREALFSSLESLLTTMVGRRIADLYAGSGAVALEALSRGAVHALLVESAKPATMVLRRNVESIGLPGAVVEESDVRTLVARAPDAAYDVVFLDPPYDADAAHLASVLRDVVRHGWLSDAGVVVVERATRDGAPPWPDGVAVVRSRKYGDTTLWYGRRS